MPEQNKKMQQELHWRDDDGNIISEEDVIEIFRRILEQEQLLK